MCDPQVSVLEFIHENEYVHADIKAANLLLGYRNPEQVKLGSEMNMMCSSHIYTYIRFHYESVLQVYLADYGLSYRYCPAGVHKEYKECPKKGHNGTIEYTSLDAHRGLGETSTSYSFIIHQ